MPLTVARTEWGIRQVDASLSQKRKIIPPPKEKEEWEETDGEGEKDSGRQEKFTVFIIVGYVDVKTEEFISPRLLQGKPSKY